MKKIAKLVGIAVLGGVLTLGGYKMLLEKPQVVIERVVTPTAQAIQANYTTGDTVAGKTAAKTATSFTVAAEKTVHAVVHVKNTAIKTQINRSLEYYFGSGSGTRKYEQIGTGSGVVISPDGYIVTNNHVIDNATALEVTLNNQKKYKAALIGTDPENDIALLKIDADEQLAYIPFANSDAVQIGEWVLAVGNPYNLTSTVTAGIVSAKGRDLQGTSGIDSFIQTDAAVNPGNSGGALVNTRGELVGINTAISSETGSFVGYSFAVPSNIAKKVTEDLMEYGKVQEAVLGIMVAQNFDQIGVEIGGFSETSEAKKAGLKRGDIIKKVNAIAISKFSDLKGQLKAKRPNETVAITVDRGGEMITKEVKLSKKIPHYISNVFKWELKNITKKELEKLGIESGVLIIKTADDTAKNSLKRYIITSINTIKIKDAEKAVQILDALGRNRRSEIIIDMIRPDGEKDRFRFR
jgi:S1-C subfamily serine protease